jgi:general secretion pathway protein J
VSGGCPSVRRRPAGFTLLEVIISMTLLALIVGICYAAFHLGIRAVEKGEVAVVTAQRLRVATDVLIRQVKSTAAHPALIDGDTYPYFYGSPTTMSLVTDAGQLSGGGRARVTYRFETDPPRLVLEESPYFDAESLGRGTPDATQARSAVILDGFRSMSFQYLLDDGSEAEWHNSWDFTENEVLPAAVRILIEGLPGLEEDVWGQEIPIMTAAYGESAGELGDEGELQDCDNLETAGTATDGKQTPGASGGKAASDDAEDPEEPDN